MDNAGSWMPCGVFIGGGAFRNEMDAASGTEGKSGADFRERKELDI